MKILYLTHTDWNWIRQRSHFIVHELQKWADVDVRFKYSLRRKHLLKQPKPEKCRGVFCLPFRFQRWTLIRRLDRAIMRTYFRWLTSRRGYDVVIVTHPLLWEYARGFEKVVYDLHDDNAEFYSMDSFLHRYISKKNMDTLAAAKAVIFSSRWLYDKYASKAAQAIVIRNGHNVPETCIEKARKETMTNALKKIFYFGTISQWLDMELVLFSLEKIGDIEYHIIGPSDVRLCKHDRVKYYGPVKHEVMLQISRDADGFVMPFRITSLIEGVDPVKLYEYVALSKPILVPHYQEIDRFSCFVHFYRNKQEYVELLRDLCAGRLTGIGVEERNNFLRENSWSIRGQAYAEFLDRVINR